MFGLRILVGWIMAAIRTALTFFLTSMNKIESMQRDEVLEMLADIRNMTKEVGRRVKKYDVTTYLEKLEKRFEYLLRGGTLERVYHEPGNEEDAYLSGFLDALAIIEGKEESLP